MERTSTILLVEDNEDNQEIYRIILAHHGYQVLQAYDGGLGVEMARAHAPDLILMDLTMPLIDGLAATRLLKEDPATASIPVIALTAHASREDQERARKSGCCDYLTKPIDRDTLVSAIRRNLIQQRSKRSHA